MLILYAITMFLGAALLFLVEPMGAKLVLPLLGGSPAVWNTCMVFFQAALLAGYLGAHLLGKARPRVQVAVYGAALAIPIAGSIALNRLLIDLPQGWTPPSTGSPIPWLLALLAVMLGAPFVVIAAAAPLLQRWFSMTGHRAAKDPYFLYAASNAGSMLALLGYPLFVEPGLTLRDQRWGWSAAFGSFAMLAMVCGVVFQRSALRVPALASAGRSLKPVVQVEAPPEPLTWKQRLWWIFLAAVPSSLVLGATQYLSTDIAAVPLLWVVPLAIYLLTFIVAFSTPPAPMVQSLSKIVPILAISLAIASLVRGFRLPASALFALNLLGLLLLAQLCHSRLARSRPRAAHLTEFYLLIAVGGALGGLFNALIAPQLFTTVAEYPIAICLALLARDPAPWAMWDRLSPKIRRIIAVLAPVLVAAAVLGLGALAGSLEQRAKLAVTLGVPGILCYLMARRRVMFAAAMAAMFASSIALTARQARFIYATRTFFGIYHVNRSDGETMLEHGTTLHGLQSTEPGKAHIPLGYYHPDGPIGQVFHAFAGSKDASGRPLFEHIGLVGLGTGALAAYGEPGQRITFHEIDPAIVRIAENPGLFTYLRDCKAAYDIKLGDGRLTLGSVPDGEYGMILLDAFSSDAIPIHMMTLDAVRLYTAKLKPGGLMAFHISNQYLSLAPILARIAEELHLAIIGEIDETPLDEQEKTGHYTSTWVLLARDRADFGALLKDGRWRTPKATSEAPLWTDDYSNIITIFRWK